MWLFVRISLRSFFLFRFVAFPAPETVHQIFQIASDYFFEQIGFWPFECSGDFKIDGRIPRLLRWLEIRPDRLEKLRANFLIDGQPRIQVKFATKTHRAGGGE